MNNIYQRFITSIGIALFVILAIFSNQLISFVCLSIILFVSSYEWYFLSSGKDSNFALIFAGLYTILIFYQTYLASMISAVLPLAFYLDHIIVISGYFYWSIFVYSTINLYLIDIYLLLQSIIIAFFTDVGGYIVGNIIGGKKLCLQISPNKTVFGSLGGIILAIISTFLIGKILFNLNFIYNIPIIIIISISSQLGDLLISILKRKVGFKDTGNILPGHGGILDRIDSIIMSNIVMFYIIKYIIN